jgi:hypothetical protein
MINDFINDRMGNYIAGGMSAQSAVRFTMGELGAIYRGNHYSRDVSGAMRPTLPPENMDIETALRKADAAIQEIISRKYPATVLAPEKPRNVYQGSAAIKQALAAGIGIKDFYAKTLDNDPAAYTADLEKIAAWWSRGRRRFKAFIRGRFLVMDIDRKPGKPDGLKMFYRLFPRETLPEELQNLPESFPCYVASPSGGFHLYFKYDGPEFKVNELAPSVETKEWQIAAPGSYKKIEAEGGMITKPYILHGELDDAPPLYGLIIDAIEDVKRKKEREKAARSLEHSRPRSRVAADRPMRYTQSRTTLDTLADEAAAKYGGHHDRQVSFAGRACRCKFSGAETLAYVKSRPDVFGNGADTERCVLSVFRDNGAA